MKLGIKHILLCIIMVALFLPLLQENFNLSKIRPLAGDYTSAEDVPITQKSWFNRKFQDQKEKFLHDHFGYHNTFVRLHNQISFELFNKAKANGVIVGKNNYLYESNYIDAYYGSDFIGVDSIRKKMLMVSFLADTLKKLNKTFMVVFAPGKAAYFPEFIPENKKEPKGITNMEVYSRFAREMNIPHIDFHSWFLQQKSKSQYPLIPRYGIHWSQYGSILATDSILKTIERSRGVDMADLYWKQLNVEKGKGTDIDIESGMNLLFEFKPEPMAYPEVFFEDTVGKYTPSVLVVADSYYWQIFAMGVSNIFETSDFWYYFQEAHNPKFEKEKKMKHINVPDEIDKHEVIIIMSSDIHLPEFGWNFIETLFAYYKGSIAKEKLDPDYMDKILKAKSDISNDENWMKIISEKAKERNISVDSMLFIDAKWCVTVNENKTKKSN